MHHDPQEAGEQAIGKWRSRPSRILECGDLSPLCRAWRGSADGSDISNLPLDTACLALVKGRKESGDKSPHSKTCLSFLADRLEAYPTG